MAKGHIAAADYVAGRTSPADRQAAEEHLADCPECRAAVEAVPVLSGRTGRRARARQRTGDATNTLLSFTARLIVGGITMLAPPLRRLSLELPSPRPEAKVVRPAFEPLRVL